MNPRAFLPFFKSDPLGQGDANGVVDPAHFLSGDTCGNDVVDDGVHGPQKLNLETAARLPGLAVAPAQFAIDIGEIVPAISNVVVEREGVGLGLLQKVDDVAVLMGALGGVSVRTIPGRATPSSLAEVAARGRAGGSGLGVFYGFEDEWGFAGAGVHEGNCGAAVGLGENLRWDREAGEFVARGEHDLVAMDAERAVEDDGFAVGEVALGIFVGLDDDDATLAVLRGRGGRA